METHDLSKDFLDGPYLIASHIICQVTPLNTVTLSNSVTCILVVHVTEAEAGC